MEKFKSFYELESRIARSFGSSIIRDIVELARKELLDKPRTTDKATKQILKWWNDLKVKPTITSHRLSYFALFHLRKEYHNHKKQAKA